MSRKNHSLAAALIAALVILAAVIMAVVPHGGAAQRPRPSAVVSMPAAQTPGIPVVDLSGVQWADYRGYRLPVSAQAGPLDTADGRASGFTDTPLGALLAVINIGARTASQFGPRVFAPTIQDQVTGPYSSQMLSGDQQDYAASAGQAQQPVINARIVAYQWDSYTSGDATVDVVASATGQDGTTVYVDSQMHAEWINSDWRLVAPPGGDWGNSAAQVPSLNGYLTFPGQEG